jgi:hypothetical protein
LGLEHGEADYTNSTIQFAAGETNFILCALFFMLSIKIKEAQRYAPGFFYFSIG